MLDFQAFSVLLKLMKGGAINVLVICRTLTPDWPIGPILVEVELPQQQALAAMKLFFEIDQSRGIESRCLAGNDF